MKTRKVPARVDGKTETVRCAIYTRKSTEKGLDQEFSTLDAQRAAGEAYIESQKHQGWVCLSDRYDDGGYSGGTIDRPALARLLADIEVGKVDAIVVYKLDRLSRSILDFSQLMETLERCQVSFVSVTELFNTQTPSGRMVLNMLANFAQFEREVIAERTRDKMGAARRRGRWVGGMPVLGYDVAPGGGRLLVNEAEAEQVRAILGLYIETRSTLATLREIRRRGWTQKRWMNRRGQECGGGPFDRQRLLYLLKNRVYVGQVSYQGTVYPGEHTAIVEQAVWDEAQRVIARNGATAGGAFRNRNTALLKGLLRCEPCDRAMTLSWSSKAGKRYRYYVCGTAMRQGWASCPTKSVPAGEIERLVVEQIRVIGTDPALVAKVLEEARATGQSEEDWSVALHQFSPVWDSLTTTEQARAVELLVERVAYDGVAGRISLTFRPTGIRALIEGGV
jgi:site-specific DNA recombinase